MTVGADTMDQSLMTRVVTDDVYGDNNLVFDQSLTRRQWLTTVRPDVTHDLLYNDNGDRANCVYPETRSDACFGPGRHLPGQW